MSFSVADSKPEHSAGPIIQPPIPCEKYWSWQNIVRAASFWDFEQFFCRQGILKRGTVKQRAIRTETVFPTAWNHLEAGILFGLHLPLLVFKEDGITDGVFDNGVTDVFIYPIPKRTIKAGERQALRQVFNKWQADVRNHYYGI